MGKRMKKSQMAIWLPDEIIAWMKNNKNKEEIIISHFVEKAIKNEIERSENEKYNNRKLEKREKGI